MCKGVKMCLENWQVNCVAEVGRWERRGWGGRWVRHPSTKGLLCLAGEFRPSPIGGEEPPKDFKRGFVVRFGF